MKKNTFILTLCMWCMALAVHAQHIPTLEEAVYGGLIRTEGGGSVNWMKDGEHYSKIERNAAGGMDGVQQIEAADGHAAEIVLFHQTQHAGTVIESASAAPGVVEYRQTALVSKF